MTIDELETIRQKIALGTIPQQLPVAADGALDEGWACAVCDGTILSSETEIVGHRRLHDSQAFHVQCFVTRWRTVSATRCRQ